MTNQELVARYMHAVAKLMDAALNEYGTQVGDEALGDVLHALRAGAMFRTTTTVALSGERLIAFDVVAPNGEEINLGRVNFDDCAVN